MKATRQEIRQATIEVWQAARLGHRRSQLHLAGVLLGPALILVGLVSSTYGLVTEASDGSWLWFGIAAGGVVYFGAWVIWLIRVGMRF